MKPHTVRRTVVIPFLCAVIVGCGHSRAPVIPLLNRPAAHDLREGVAVDEARRLYREGLYDQACAAAEALTNAGSRHPELLYLQAEMAAQRGDHLAAATWCEQAIAASPLWPEPRIQLAQSWLKLERFAAAESVFGDIERIVPTSPWGPYGIGAVAAMRGDAARATTYADQALSRDPNHQPSLSLAAHLARQSGAAAREEELLMRLTTLNPGDAATWARIGELSLAGNRTTEGERSLERAYALEARPVWAKTLADLATRRGDPVAAARWRSAAGTREPLRSGEGEPSEPSDNSLTADPPR